MKVRKPTTNARKRKARNPLRADPTRTAGLRRQFEADLRRRFARLRAVVVQLVAVEDAFGLREPVANQRWRFRTSDEKVRAFRDWLTQQMRQDLHGRDLTRLQPSRLQGLTPATDPWSWYVEQGFRQGAGRAFDDTRAGVRAAERSGDVERDDVSDFYAGTKDEFLRSAFGRPVAAEKVKLLAGRTLDELDGVTATMATKMGRALADAMVKGQSPREIAGDLADEVDIGKSRALTIARTEIIRAHAEGQLTAMEELGVEEVGVSVEWLVTDDEKLCPRCEALKGIVLKIEEARGMLPLHPS